MEKRLYRSRTDRMLFGVCGGLAQYFDLDPTLVRLIFVLIVLAGGTGILAYIVLAIVMPEESSVAVHPREVLRENIAEIKETAKELGEELRAGFGGQAGVPTERRTRGAYTAGLILILLGVVFLMSNFHLFWWFNWHLLWPLILVAIGVALLFRRRA
ncbi:MAG: PspC domain-containing protein [Chloroflexi bacterium]|nr:PspC domain-containing protein [Chloroflexota bacterium]